MVDILAEARSFEEELMKWRRHIHGLAELGMDVPKTSGFVTRELEAMGYKTQALAGTGVVAMVGPEEGGGVLLLRADMDALPIREENDLDFKAVNGNCHACGHDLHTAMLLGAARILKRHEKELACRVKLMFQPAEEVLKGARAMIEAGVLDNPPVDAAVMMHTFTGYACPTGILMVNDVDYVMPSCDMFEIEIQGKGGHGSTPELCIDPLNIAVHTHLALQELMTREVAPWNTSVSTIGYIRPEGGEATNIIPEKVRMGGTFRTYSPENRLFLRKRIQEIAEGVAKTFRGGAVVNWIDTCPAFKIDRGLAASIREALVKIMPVKEAIIAGPPDGSRMLGSEDFAFISEKVATAYIGIAAGNSEEGHIHNAHNPKTTFDERALAIGAAAYAGFALQWSKEGLSRQAQ